MFQMALSAGSHHCCHLESPSVQTTDSLVQEWTGTLSHASYTAWSVSMTKDMHRMRTRTCIFYEHIPLHGCKCVHLLVWLHTRIQTNTYYIILHTHTLRIGTCGCHMYVHQLGNFVGICTHSICGSLLPIDSSIMWASDLRSVSSHFAACLNVCCWLRVRPLVNKPTCWIMVYGAVAPPWCRTLSLALWANRPPQAEKVCGAEGYVSNEFA